MGRISEEDIARVRDATDIVSLVSESVVLKQKGRLFWGNCPFHGEKTPSFKIDPATGLWHCFGCGAGGDAFGFVMRAESLEFPDAVRQLADRGRIEIVETGESLPRGHRERLVAASEEASRFYHRTLVTSTDQKADAARRYLARRGFGSDVAKRFDLGWSPGHTMLVKHLTSAGFNAEEILAANLAVRGDDGQLRDRFYGRIMFPIRDVTGRTVAFGGRILGDGEPKYLNTGETTIFHKSSHLYAIERAKNEIVKARTAIVVEGYTDVIALHEAGIPNVVATLGTALTRQHVKLLGRFAARIVYLFDADEAGLRAAERAAEFIDVSVSPEGGGSLIELAVAIIPDAKDPADYVAAAGADAMREVVDGAVPLLRFVLDRRMATHDTHTPEGRSRALADAASVLAVVRGTLLAQDYANYVADRLLTDFATVEVAVARARPAFARATPESPQDADSSPVQAPKAERPTTQIMAERELVGLVAAYPGLRLKARTLLTSDLLTDTVALRILDAVLASENATGGDLYARVSSDDREAAEVLAGLIVEAESVDDAEFVATEVLSKLKELAVERQIIEKKARMRALDPHKDRDAHDELFREIAALQVRHERLRSGEVDEHDKEVWG